MIVSLDGWAGTQRHAGIWTGDQTGGPMGIYSLPYPNIYRDFVVWTTNVGSDMDGIFVEKIKRSTYVISNGKLLHQCS